MTKSVVIKITRKTLACQPFRMIRFSILGTPASILGKVVPSGQKTSTLKALSATPRVQRSLVLWRPRSISGLAMWNLCIAGQLNGVGSAQATSCRSIISPTVNFTRAPKSGIEPGETSG